MDAIIQASTSKLNDNNYHLWKLRTESTLKAKEAWIAITKPDPGDDPANANAKIAWEKACNIAMGYMTNTMEDSILGQFINVSTPKELWEKLKDKYQANTGIKKIDLRNQLASLKMQADEDWQSYILRANNLGERAKAVGMDITDNEIGYQIMKGLPAKYHMLKASFATQTTIDMDLLKRALKDEDEQNGTRAEKDSAYRARAMRGRFNQAQKRIADERCWHCNKRGHKKSECWKLHGKQGNKNFRSQNEVSTHQKFVQKNRNAEARIIRENATNDDELWFVDENEREKKDEATSWILDSGATSHMCSQREWIRDFVPQQRQVKLADESLTEIIGKGTVRLLSHETGKEITVKDVLYVPSLRGNLISVTKITKGNNGSITFDKEGAKIFSNKGNQVATAKLNEDFYELEVDTLTEKLAQVECEEDKTDNREQSLPESQTKGTMAKEQEKQLWHRRLNHLNEEAMNQLQKQNMTNGLNFKKEDKLDICHPCSTAKFNKLPYRSIGNYQSTRPLELLHMDLCGPFPVASLGGSKYMMTIIDDYTRMNFTLFLKTKDQVKEKLETLLLREENKTKRKVKTIRTDNGGEFIGHDLQSFLNQKGISHQLTTPYSPQSNGIAERMNRTIVEAVRTMLIDSALPQKFWAEAAATASYTRNACPTKINGSETPYEKYNGRKPTMNHLRVFGCLVYYHVEKEKRTTKLTPNGKIGIFTGYSDRRLAYRVYDPESGNIIETRHVKFHENQNGSKQLKQESQEETMNLTYDLLSLRQKMRNEQEEPEEVHPDEQVQQERIERPPPRRSERIRKQNEARGPPLYDETIETDTDSDASEVNPRTHVIKELTRPEPNEEITVPQNYEEAIASPYKEQWLEAMQEEINSLKTHDVWKLEKKPKSQKTIPSKWVFKIKRNPDGSVEKFKARLVAVGCTQKFGQDYDETFSPVVHLESLRTLLAIAMMNNMTVKFYDVTTAYLHGELKDDIYMEQPEGFEEGNPDEIVCHLQRGIYGLKQSGRIWYSTLREHLLKNGFTQLESDPCIFSYKTDTECLYVAVYVDDLITAGSSDTIIQEGVEIIQEKFSLTEVKENAKILGWNCKWTEGELKISQETYAADTLKRFQMENCKAVNTPLEPGQTLHNFQDSEPIDVKLYQEIVGSLMYLMTGTRPDLSFAVATLSKFLTDPREIHLKAAKRCLRYLKGTTEKGLIYSNKEGRLKGFADASWNDGQANEKSTTGYVIQIGENTIHWKSQKQQNVSLSTCQSEITAIGVCMKELMWLRALIAELGGERFLPSAIPIYNDNQAAISSTKEIATYSKIKHYVRSALFIRQQVERGNYSIQYVPGTELCADAFTKAVTTQKLIECASHIKLQ